MHQHYSEHFHSCTCGLFVFAWAMQHSSWLGIVSRWCIIERSYSSNGLFYNVCNLATCTRMLSINGEVSDANETSITFTAQPQQALAHNVMIRDLLQSSGSPQAEVRIASRGKCKNTRQIHQVIVFEGLLPWAILWPNILTWHSCHYCHRV